MIVCLYGPAGTGKTILAPRLAKHLGLSYVLDEYTDLLRRRWFGVGERITVPHNSLVIAEFHDLIPNVRIDQWISVEQAKEMLKVAFASDVKAEDRLFLLNYWSDQK